MTTNNQNANGQELLHLLRRGVKADIVLLDYEMPVLNGLETLEQIKRDYFGLKVIMLTMLNSRELVQSAVALGVSGFLFKNASLDELSEAIRHVAKGENYFSSEVTLTLLHAAPKPEQFAQAVRFGQRPDGKGLRHQMPPFATLTDEEVAAIWNYLQTVPPVKNAVERNFEK